MTGDLLDYIITSDFNTRDSDWDPNFHYYHSIYTKDLMTIADSLGLGLSLPSNPGPTQYADNPHDTNFVLDLVFLLPNNSRLDKHTLLPEICKPSDHIPLTIEVGIEEENIDIIVQSIKKDSNEKKDFMSKIGSSVKHPNSSANINKDTFQEIIDQLFSVYENAWTKHSKPRCITKHLKEWWNQNCTHSLTRYHKLGDLAS